ncbi:hypothetical protein [Nocardiopsis metallicus]|uniref:Uncharacterized protein n=1 Tax=Nocardiopsis metallicus TaxID=179819 RepID=A0A840WM59_9ACTN|nr:hypothetical protein [Nocardiopsis metallicus]MBB5494081.1 hypothetical protein [Nocardiopsis metallicus]
MTSEQDSMRPDEVGEFYDDRGWLYEIFMGQNLHIGWWDEVQPELDPKDRLTDVLIERTELSDQLREVLKEGFTVSALPTAQEYQSLFAEAGFTVARTTDATPHLRRSAERIEHVVAEHYPTVVHKGGREFAEEFRAMISQVSVLERDHLGYTIVEATA